MHAHVAQRVILPWELHWWQREIGAGFWAVIEECADGPGGWAKANLCCLKLLG